MKKFPIVIEIYYTFVSTKKYCFFLSKIIKDSRRHQKTLKLLPKKITKIASKRTVKMLINISKEKVNLRNKNYSK